MKTLIFLLTALQLGSVCAQETAQRLVRESDAQPPEVEQAGFHVPEGFSVQLFASEPMINKPINMAFDARGRLWVSSTVEYPYAAVRDRWSDATGHHVKDSRDAIKILEDTDGDGRADKVTDFADGLNIPTGVLPWHKPEHKDGCIAWSIPNIWYFADTDGDGRADLREVLFGPLGFEKDTHGMCSSFRLGLDGWVYATHGFNNTSHFKAKDGSTLDLNSGNVFRFRPDGSHVEIWSWGQVNPFGLCWDRYNNLYSADCHSNPVTQLIRGAHYPSFGKPHDGLGFGPVMCQHSHGSTGLCGIVYIDGCVWGPEWDDHMLLGNCVTSKVNHDTITFVGSTPKANEAPDFITSDDPWFRPVDLQLGPDNALYVADFYNKIIGHYEVPLDHPGRDKERGRIWRVVKDGTNGQPLSVLSRKPLGEFSDLDRTNSMTRRLALQTMTEKYEKPFFLTSPSYATSVMRTQWWRLALARRSGRALTPVNGYEFDRGAQALQITDEDFIEVLQQFIEFGPTTSLGGEGVRAGLLEGHSRVKLAAALAMRAHPDRAYMEPLLRTLENCDAHDETLRHALKLAVREHCRDGELFKLAADSGPRSLIVEVATALPTSEAAEFLLHDLESDRSSGEATRLHHIARYGRPETITQLVAIASERAPEDVQALAAIYGGLQESGVVYPKELLAWATQAAEGLLGLEVANRHQWTFLGDGENPFCLQERKCADGKSVSVISSLNHDLKGPEKLTGILRSAAFSAPERLSFWLCGHQGFPNEPANEKNFVRLVDQKGALLQKALPPRDDVCQRIEWDLSAIQGKQVRMEIVDGDDGRSYAWLGVTRIEPAVVDVATFDSDATRQKNLRTLAGILQYTAPATLRERLAAYLPPRPAPPPLPVSAEQRQQLDALIQARAKAFASANPDTQMGKVLFTNNCAICHQIGGAGGLIGPQLDGIKNRGVDRLCEDILDPNRNVDAHFHLHVIKMKDGNAAAGFLRGEYGQVVELVDTAGQSHRVSKGDIVEEQITPMSVMPPTFGQTLDEKNFVDLVGWLMTQ